MLAKIQFSMKSLLKSNIYKRSSFAKYSCHVWYCDVYLGLILIFYILFGKWKVFFFLT